MVLLINLKNERIHKKIKNCTKPGQANLLSIVNEPDDTATQTQESTPGETKGDSLCSEGSMFRRFYVQKIFVQTVLCSEGSIFRRSYVQKVLCSEGPIFRRSYVQKVLCSEKNCSKGPIFRRFYVQEVLYSDIFRRSYIQEILCFM